MNNVKTIPSFTTRAPRPTDVPGETYVFLSKEEFEEKIRNGEVYEYDIHHDNYYGTSKEFLNNAAKEGIVIKDIDVNGTERLQNELKDIKIVSIFLRVPKDILRERLKKRDDNLSDEDIEKRLDRLEYEESKIDIYDYVIDNIDLEKTLNQVEEIIKNAE